MITGGASGIGLGSAKAFLAAGLNVIIADIRPDHLAGARDTLADGGERVLLLELDVNNKAQWSLARAAVEERFGNVHVLFLNAGVGVLGSMIDATADDYEWITAVNLAGVLNGLSEFLPHIIGHGERAHIVATSSMGGLIVANDGGIYSSAKFGVVAAIEQLRRELSGSAVGASVLCPAAVNTNIFDHERVRPGYHGGSLAATEPPELAKREAMAKTILALGRSPVEVGQMVIDGIIADAPYIFTDRNVAPTLLKRRDALLACAEH
jgi:NADP-dependent 3-hydroxy acid dehydrogenase YdfG